MRRGCRKSFTIYASLGSSFLGRISTSLGPFWVIFVSICPALINYDRSSPPNGLRGAALVTFVKTRCGSGDKNTTEKTMAHLAAPAVQAFPRSALRRTPSLRSLVLLRCAQSPSFAALSPWLRHAAGFACGLFVFEAAGFACGKNTLTVELSDFPRRDD